MTAPSTTSPHPSGRPTRLAAASPRRRRRAVGVAAALLALGLGACSASGGDASADPGPTTTAAPATTEAPAPDPDPEPDPEPTPTTEATDPDPDPDPDPDGDLAAIEARLDAINLTLEDLPEGWTSEPAIEKSTTVVEDCTALGGPDHVLARSSSDRFSLVVDGGGLGLDTSSGYVADVDTAADLLSELGSSDFAACATEQLLAGGEDVTVDGAFQPIDGGLDLGDGATALQGDFHLSDATGQSAQMSVLIITIRTDQILTTVSAISYDVPGDEQLLYQVLDLVAARQAA